MDEETKINYLNNYCMHKDCSGQSVKNCDLCMYTKGREDERNRIVKIVKEMKNTGIYCFEKICIVGEPTPIDCEICALAYLLDNIEKEQNK